MTDESATKMNRREFTALTVAGACACCAACSEANAADTGGSEPVKKPLKPKVDVGALDSFKADGPIGKFAQPNKFLIVVKGGRIYAPSARCTHKGCILKVVDKAMACPCHGSRFDDTGHASDGRTNPPLFRYAISVNENKRVMVDPNQQFDEADWEKPEAFVEIK